MKEPASTAHHIRSCRSSLHRVAASDNRSGSLSAGVEVVRQTRVVVNHYGGPEELRLIEEDCSQPKRGEVRVKVLAAGVSLPDIMMREGIHPETPRLPFTPGWDLVGEVDRLGEGVSGFEAGQIVASLPISGAYTQFLCLQQSELIPVPSGLDPAEAVSLILNYVTAYQMLHRSAKVRNGQRVLIQGASGGVGSALLQLGGLAGLEMYGTCSARGAPAVSEMGGIPIDYTTKDYVAEIRRLTADGVDVVFDSLGGAQIWRARQALRRGGRVVAYGLTGSLRGGRLASGSSGGRHRFRAIAVFGLYIAASWLLPGRKTSGAVQHPVAQTPPAGIFQKGSGRAFRAPAAGADQAAHCRAIPSGKSQRCSGAARTRRGHRQNRFGHVKRSWRYSIATRIQ